MVNNVAVFTELVIGKVVIDSGISESLVCDRFKLYILAYLLSVFRRVGRKESNWRKPVFFLNIKYSQTHILDGNGGYQIPISSYRRFVW